MLSPERGSRGSRSPRRKASCATLLPGKGPRGTPLLREGPRATEETRKEPGPPPRRESPLRPACRRSAIVQLDHQARTEPARRRSRFAKNPSETLVRFSLKTRRDMDCREKVAQTEILDSS